MWMSLIAATLWKKTCKKTATCRNFVHILFSGQHTKLSTLCSNVVAMWSRVDQGPGSHVVTTAVQKGATSVRSISNMSVFLTVRKMFPFALMTNYRLSAVSSDHVTGDRFKPHNRTITGLILPKSVFSRA